MNIVYIYIFGVCIYIYYTLLIYNIYIYIHKTNIFVYTYIRIEDRPQYNDVNIYIGHTFVKSLGSFGFVIPGGWGWVHSQSTTKMLLGRQLWVTSHECPIYIYIITVYMYICMCMDLHTQDRQV